LTTLKSAGIGVSIKSEKVQMFFFRKFDKDVQLNKCISCHYYFFKYF
jgi:hypothetical protein